MGKEVHLAFFLREEGKLFEQRGRRRRLLCGEDLRVLAEELVYGEHLRLRRFLVLDERLPLECREEIENVEIVKNLLANAVDAADALDDARRIPRNVVVDDKPRAVQVESFAELVRREQDVIVVKRVFHFF